MSAAESRLFLIPTFDVRSFFSRLNAWRRSRLKLASAWPFRIRHWSSPKVTSSCPNYAERGQSVFHGPVASNGSGKLLARQLSTQNVITTFDRFLPVTQRAGDRHADRSQLRPAGGIGQVVRHGTHEGFAFGLATMCLLVRPVKTAAFEDVVITQVKGEVRDHSIKQSRLVAFDRQDIIRLLIHDRFSDFHLTARIFVFQGGRRS